MVLVYVDVNYINAFYHSTLIPKNFKGVCKFINKSEYLLLQIPLCRCHHQDEGVVRYFFHLQRIIIGRVRIQDLLCDQDDSSQSGPIVNQGTLRVNPVSACGLLTHQKLLLDYFGSRISHFGLRLMFIYLYLTYIIIRI